MIIKWLYIFCNLPTITSIMKLVKNIIISLNIVVNLILLILVDMDYMYKELFKEQ